LQREALPPTAEAEEAQRAQIVERAFWFRRDLAQTSVNVEMCNRMAEIVSLVDANNAGPE
jgi:hypothetical protein